MGDVTIGPIKTATGEIPAVTVDRDELVLQVCRLIRARDGMHRAMGENRFPAVIYYAAWVDVGLTWFHALLSTPLSVEGSEEVMNAHEDFRRCAIQGWPMDVGKWFDTFYDAACWIFEKMPADVTAGLTGNETDKP